MLAAGCTTMPTTADLGDPMPGDDDLQVLVVRRTTYEWVLRTIVAAEPSVATRSGVGVTGLIADVPAAGAVPVVTGVRLGDGSTVDADAVVAATGRRGPVDRWLADVGVEIDEKVVESGLMYLSRWYELPATPEIEMDAKLGGDLGFVKYLGVPGDGDTLSITLAVRTADKDLRSALGDADRFEQACRVLPGPDRFFRDGPLEPIGGVRPMGGLLNRRRRFVDDSAPLVLGFHALGDAHTCTNPLYGRGCSIALVQAIHLADAFAAHPDDPSARATAYEQAAAAHIEPWFDVSVQMDRLGADPAGLHSFCRAHGIVLEAYSPLSHGKVLHSPALAAAAAAHGKSAAQAALAYIVARGHPLVTRSGSAAHLRDDLDIFGWKLSESELAALDAVDGPSCGVEAPGGCCH